jgi:hypothetical protein
MTEMMLGFFFSHQVVPRSIDKLDGAQLRRIISRPAVTSMPVPGCSNRFAQRVQFELSSLLLCLQIDNVAIESLACRCGWLCFALLFALVAQQCQFSLCFIDLGLKRTLSTLRSSRHGPQFARVLFFNSSLA